MYLPPQSQMKALMAAVQSQDANKDDMVFEYRRYPEDFTKYYDMVSKVTVPHIDNFRYVLWEKDYVCKWMIKNFKSEMKNTILVARYRAYPYGKGRQKTPPGESLRWVKQNMPYICLIHVYADLTAASKTFLQFREEFDEAHKLMILRNAAKTRIATFDNSKNEKQSVHSPLV